MPLFGFDEQFTLFGSIPLENQFILEYLPGAKGDYVKVYLYGLMHCYHPTQDMSLTAMARELNLTESNVKVTLHRTREALREYLGKEDLL